MTFLGSEVRPRGFSEMTNDRLRSALSHAGLTVEEVARRAEVDPKTVHRWIAGVRMWTVCLGPQKLFALIELFGETPAVTWMRHPAGDPAVDGLGVHLGAAGHFLDRQSGMREG